MKNLFYFFLIFTLLFWGCQTGRKTVKDISDVSDKTEARTVIEDLEGGTVRTHIQAGDNNTQELYEWLDETEAGFTGISGGIVTSGLVDSEFGGIGVDASAYSGLLGFTTGTASSVDTISELVSMSNLGAYMTTMFAATDEANFKSIANLEAGTDFNSYSDYLADISGLTPTQYYLLGWDGSSNVVNISSINDSVIPSTITRDTELTDGSVDAVFNSISAPSVSSTASDGSNRITFSENTNRTPGAGTYEIYQDTAAGGLVYVNGDGVENLIGSGSGGGDDVSVDSTSVTDPDFVSTGDIDFVDTSNTITANINSGVIETTEINATTLITSSETGTTATDTQIPTWKAVKDYLDSIIVSGLPTISITTPATSGTWVDSATYTSLAGTAFDLQGISEIAWKLESGGTYATTGVSGTTSWTVSSITLSEGTNNVYARVTDTDTNTEEDTTVINVDTIDPVNSDGGTDSTHDGSTLITLDVDNNDTNEVTCIYSSTELSLTDVSMTTTGSTGAWNVTDSSIDPNGSTNTIDLVVTCTDPAGNFDTDTYNVTYSSGPTVFIEDTFTEESTVDITSHTGETGATWTQHTSYPDIPRVSGTGDNALPGDTGSSMAYASGTPDDAEYTIEADFLWENGADRMFLCGRVDTTEDTYYAVRYDHSDGAWDLVRSDAGSLTILDTYVQALTVDQTYAITFIITNAAKTVEIDSVQRLTSSDNTITAAGRVAIKFDGGGTANRLDNLTCTN